MRLVLLLLLVPSLAWSATDSRYCGTPKRDANGNIVRSLAVKNDFRSIHPCPQTGKTTGACVGWQVDHVIPLACGGCDSVHNMQWLPDQIKTCSDVWCKDRFERNIYGGVVAGTSCKVPK